MDFDVALCRLTFDNEIRDFERTIYMKIVSKYITLLFWTGLTLFIFVHPSRASIPDAFKKMYVWKTEGIVLYASPSFDAEPIGQIAYGTCLTVENTLAVETMEIPIYTFNEEDWISDEYLKEYHLPSDWLHIKHNGLSGYVLDTYLSVLPPPDSAHHAGFFVEDYVKSLATVIDQKSEDKTEEFCARDSFSLENGIQFTHTDFGPCEQCGHIQLQLYLPSVGKKEATMIAFHFFSLYGLFTGENNTLLKEKEGTLALEGYMEYGQLFTMRIIEHENGVLLIEDTYL